MDPGIVVANVGHFKQIFVQPRADQRFLEKFLVGAGCTGCNHNPVQVLFTNDLRYLVLSILAAGKQVFFHIDDPGQSSGIFHHFRHTNDAADIGAAVAHKHTDSRPGTHHFFFRRNVESLCARVSGRCQFLGRSAGRGAGFHNGLGNILRTGKRATGIDPRHRGSHRRERTRRNKTVFIKADTDSI